RVLVRDTTLVEEEGVGSIESFYAGKINGSFYTRLTTLRLKKEQESFDGQQAVQDLIAHLESEGAKNILTDVESYTTPSHIEGQKISGGFTIDHQSGHRQNKTYTSLIFPSNVGVQQIVVVYDKNDFRAQEIADRIIYAMELRPQG